jgi:Ni2+-binding GTPase involved in maturation of urease and hydrogenase
MFTLVLTGPPGAGKTSVLEALSDALTADDIGHAAIEVEALTSAHPPLDDEQWAARGGDLCAVSPFRL